MNKLIVSLLCVIVFSFSAAMAQTSPVQITGGRFFITGRTPTSTGYGTAVMQSSVFTSTSFFTNNSSSAPWDICQDQGCKPGRSFVVPNSWALVSSEQHRHGTFTINGVTYENVFFSRGFSLSRETFSIPRIARKKGLITLKKPFKLDGSLLVCRINDFSSGCPPDQILFNDFITGHGTLTITFRIGFNPDVPPRSQVYWKAESFDYRFEP